MGLAVRVSLLWGDYFPPGDVKRERTCGSERNQVSLISNEPSPGVTAKAGMRAPQRWKPTRGTPPLQKGLPRVSFCASTSLVGAGGGLGCRGAHACRRLCPPAPTRCPHPPDCITRLRDPTATSHRQPQGGGFRLSKPHQRSRRDGGVSRAPAVAVAVLCRARALLFSAAIHGIFSVHTPPAPPLRQQKG